MKHYFFVNPAAGQGRGLSELEEEIRKTGEALQQEVYICITKSVGDGENQAREVARSLDGSEARFYACGGDGTLSEIINGAAGHANISIGCLPRGTGNDTVRSFPEGGDFLDIKAQLTGKVEQVDLIRYTGILNGIYQERFCINMFNIGFDCNVVELAGRLKQKPMIAGSMAYLMAVMGMFAQKRGINLQLMEEGETLIDGEVLLCAIANGSYCGGGMYTSPQASISDGVFDLNIIKDVPRTTFLRLFPKYQKGTHLQVPGVEKIITTRKCKALTLIPKEKNFFLCADGEIYLAETVDFEMKPKAIGFVVPEKELIH